MMTIMMHACKHHSKRSTGPSMHKHCLHMVFCGCCMIAHVMLTD